MGKETLQMLAEVKMHVCDEHLTHNEMKTQLKRSFGTVDLSSTLPKVDPPLSSFSSTQAYSTAVHQVPTNSSMPDDHPGDSRSPDISNDLTEPGAEATLTDDQPTQLLSTIVHQFIHQGELDDREPENSVPHTPLTHYSPVALEDLFDFSRDYWVKHHQRTGCHSLNEELEIYNLLDADLPGEEGAEVPVDDTAGEILTLHI